MYCPSKRAQLLASSIIASEVGRVQIHNYVKAFLPSTTIFAVTGFAKTIIDTVIIDLHDFGIIVRLLELAVTISKSQ